MQVHDLPVAGRRDFGNVRAAATPEEIQRLADSIKAHGQLIPGLSVKDADGYRIVDGNCRHAACKLLGKPTWRSLLLDKPPDESERLTLQLTVNCHRVDLTPVDKAQAYKQLLDLKRLNYTQLAAHLGISPAMVTMHLSLLRLPEELQEKVNAGGLSPSVGYLLTLAGERQQEYASRVEAGTLTRDALAGKVRKKKPETNGESKRAARVTLPGIEGVTFTAAADGGVDVDRMLAAAESLAKLLKKAQKEGMSAAALARMLRDKSKGGDGA